MELEYARTPSGLLKIIEFVVLIIGFALILDEIAEVKDYCRIFDIECPIPWQFNIFVAFTFLVAILTSVAFLAHLCMPSWMNPITSKIAYSELVFCVVSAVLVLVVSSCLADRIYKEDDQEVAACVFGFIAFALLLAECAFLYRTAESVSAA